MRLTLIISCVIFLLQNALLRAYGRTSNSSIENVITTTDGDFKTDQQNFLKKLTSLYPSFDQLLPTESSTVSCARHSRYVIQNANQLQTWALKILDSTAKIPSGLLNGNTKQLGDYDECLSSVGYYEESDEEIRGKYCVAEFEFEFIENPEINNLLYSFYKFTRELRQKHGAQYEGTNIAMWGICIPSSCSGNDVENMVKERLKRYNGSSGIKADVVVEDGRCVLSNKQPSIPWQGWIVLIALLHTVGLCIYATLQDKDKEDPKDIRTHSSDNNLVMKAFSLKRNFRTLLNTKSSGEEIECFHGIRVIHTVHFMIGHKALIYVIVFAATNKTSFVEKYGKGIDPPPQLVTDTFCFMGGTLLATTLLRQLANKNGNLITNYGIRLSRLLPTLTLLICGFTYVLPYMNEGPLWKSIITEHAMLCRRTGWRNLLFIQNYFYASEMCLPHTHQLGLDMVLFTFGSLLVYTIYKRFYVGIGVALLSAAYSSYLRYRTVIDHNIAAMTAGFHSHKVTEVQEIIYRSYSNPTHRAVVYIIGVLLGCYIFFKRREKLGRSSNLVCIWFAEVTAIACLLTAGYTPYILVRYPGNKQFIACIEVIAPILWTFGLVLITLANTSNERGGIIFRFLNYEGFKIMSRLSFAVLLSHYVVQWYDVATERIPREINLASVVNFNDQMVVMAFSMFLTIFIEMPIHNVAKSIKNHYYKRRVQQDDKKTE